MPLSAVFAKTRDVIVKATHPIRRKGWLHWLRFAGLLIIGSYMGHLLSSSDRFTDWRYWLYQKQTRIERRGPVYPRYTALVLLNDDDYYSDDYQARSKLKRDKLAALLDRLNAAGVNTVAFDVFMDSPYPDKPTYEFPDYRAGDDALFAAIGRMCTAGRHVVLTTEYWLDSPDAPTATEIPAIYMSHLPELPCVSRGSVNFPADMRQIPGTVPMKDGKLLDSLSLAITHIADPIAYQHLVENQDRGFRFAQFLTPDDFSTRDGRQFIFSGGEIEKMDISRLRQTLADKIVIVGGHYHIVTDGIGPYVDMWASPGGVEPGTMLHANYVEAMLNPDSTFTPISDRTAEILEWLFAMILALVGALEVHSGWKWAGFIISLLASVLLTFVLLQNLGIFLDFFIPILIIIGHTFTEEILEMRKELHHAKKLLAVQNRH